MPTHSHIVTIKTRGFNDTHDITGKVQEFLESSKITEGILTVFAPGSTAGITTIEYEPGAVQDLKDAIERLAPQDAEHRHNERWGDGNGFSHVRAALLGPSLSVPVTHGKLRLGTWQQIVLIDFDNRGRTREVEVQIMGDV